MRHRLCRDIWVQLEAEFAKDANWNKRKYIELSHRFELSYTKLYKWRWNRIKTGPKYDLPDIQQPQLPLQENKSQADEEHKETTKSE